MRWTLPLLSFVVAAAATEGGAAPRVVADVAPVQSIVARVMAGVGEPAVIVPPGASPHEYALKPSDARLLDQADLVIWAGEALSPWLARPIESLAGRAEVVTLPGIPGLELLPVRSDAVFERHEDEEEAVHEGAAGHAAEAGHEEEAGHAAEEGHEEETGHAAEAGHAHGAEGMDPHFWLDPVNAVAIARGVAEALAQADPAAAATYLANAEAFAGEMAALEAEIRDTLAPVADRAFVVFHDAYQYFERRFGVTAAGTISTSHANAPGAARLAGIRDRLETGGIVCAFAEPQFAPALVDTVLDGTPTRAGTLDPLGATLAPGPELYPALLRNLAEALTGCLAGA